MLRKIKKLIKGITLLLLPLFLFSITATASFDAPQYWDQPDGTGYVQLNPTSLEIGSTASRLSKLWAQEIDAIFMTITAISPGPLTVSGAHPTTLYGDGTTSFIGGDLEIKGGDLYADNIHEYNSGSGVTVEDLVFVNPTHSNIGFGVNPSSAVGRIWADDDIWLLGASRLRFGSSFANAGGVRGAAATDTAISGYLSNAGDYGIDFQAGDPRGSAMRINNDGEVGINTSDPTAPLSVSGMTILNVAAENHDTQIKGHSEEDLLYANAGTRRIGIKTNNPTALLQIDDSHSTSAASRYLDLTNIYGNSGTIRHYSYPDAGGGAIAFHGTPTFVGNAISGLSQDYPTAARGAAAIESSSGNFKIHVHDGTSYLGAMFQIDKDGSIKFNEDNADSDLQIGGSGSDIAVYLDSTNEYLGLGTNTPDEKLRVANGNIKLDNGYGIMIRRHAGGLPFKVLTIPAGQDTLEMNLPGSAAVHTYNIKDSSGVIQYTLTGNGDADFNVSQADANFNVRTSGLASAWFIQGSDGNTGIGNNTPDDKLDVAGVVDATGGYKDNGFAGLDQEITIVGTNFTHVMVFSGGLLTGYTSS